jgi:chaperone required for assembly of F1-ATPase
VIPRKRFWTEAAATATPAGFGVRLDARPLRTPDRVELLVPTRALAEGIAAEWNAVEGEIRPEALPLTRAANVAIDRIAPNPGPVVGEIARYGESDLLCYRVAAPEALRLRQEAGWNPPLAWAAETLGAPLVTAEGVLHVPQPEASLDALRAAVAACDAFALTALHELVTLSGSLVLGLAVTRRALEPGRAWALSRIDEDWQAEFWGRDAEAEALAGSRRRDFDRAARLLDLLAPDGGSGERTA